MTKMNVYTYPFLFDRKLACYTLPILSLFIIDFSLRFPPRSKTLLPSFFTKSLSKKQLRDVQCYQHLWHVRMPTGEADLHSCMPVRCTFSRPSTFFSERQGSHPFFPELCSRERYYPFLGYRACGFVSPSLISTVDLVASSLSLSLLVPSTARDWFYLSSVSFIEQWLHPSLLQFGQYE